MESDIFLCPHCKTNLTTDHDKVLCRECSHLYGFIRNDTLIFHETSDKVGFFDKQATSRLSEKYLDYSYKKFKDSLDSTELYNMDLLNKKVGITKKFWWEKHLGKIKNSSILEVGCGVNYIVPYWLDSGNNVTAFDICEESVFLLKDILKKINLYNDSTTLFVGDAENIFIDKKYDLININNVLHHIKNKKEVLIQLKNVLKDTGKIILVEPNYYYPFRWIIETDFLKPLNFFKSYFVKNDLIEKDEKAVVFSKLKDTIHEAGLKIDVNLKDINYLGYSTIYFIDSSKTLPRLIYFFDKYLLSKVLPKIIAPFEYLILSKN